jgi:hypothetical protein
LRKDHSWARPYSVSVFRVSRDSEAVAAKRCHSIDKAAHSALISDALASFDLRSHSSARRRQKSAGVIFGSARHLLVCPLLIVAGNAPVKVEGSVVL